MTTKPSVAFWVLIGILLVFGVGSCISINSSDPNKRYSATVSLTPGVDPPPTPTIYVTAAKTNLIRFLNGWQNRDFDSMANYSQRSRHVTPKTLRQDFGARKLISYQIVSVEPVSNVMVTISVKITSKVGGKTETYTMRANVIRENNAGIADGTGFWAVNEISAMNHQ